MAESVGTPGMVVGTPGVPVPPRTGAAPPKVNRPFRCPYIQLLTAGELFISADPYVNNGMREISLSPLKTH